MIYKNVSEQCMVYGEFSMDDNNDDTIYITLFQIAMLLYSLLVFSFFKLSTSLALIFKEKKCPISAIYFRRFRCLWNFWKVGLGNK